MNKSTIEGKQEGLGGSSPYRSSRGAGDTAESRGQAELDI